jgi:HK97 family phage prohead protease
MAVDNSSWDGNAAMTAASNSDNPASAFASICAGRRAGPAGERQTWALPHHKAPGDPPNAAGVRNCMARFDQTQGLTNRSAAMAHLESHMSMIQNAGQSSQPPSDVLVRSMPGNIELAKGQDGRPVLTGHFSVFNQWTRISSVFEGTFMERVAPGSFAQTIAEDRADMRVLYDHGQDPTFGNKPLGPIAELREDDIGAYYEVPLIATSYNRDMEEMLRAGLLGASFRFSVSAEDLERNPKRSDYNPEGLPERTIRAARVAEFGPVTFPAYPGATAGVRSDTDTFIQRQRLLVPEVTRELRPSRQPEGRVKRFASREEYLTWLSSI